MARFRLLTDAWRDGVYFRAGEVMVCEGDQKPPRGSLKLKAAEPVADDVELEPVATLSQLGDLEPKPPAAVPEGKAKGKDKSPI